MARRSVARAIRQKSTTVYPTNGSKPAALSARLDLQGSRTCGGPRPSDEQIEAKAIHGGYNNKKSHRNNRRTCPTCFVRLSANGECNCG